MYKETVFITQIVQTYDWCGIAMCETTVPWQCVCECVCVCSRTWVSAYVCVSLYVSMRVCDDSLRTPKEGCWAGGLVVVRVCVSVCLCVCVLHSVEGLLAKISHEPLALAACASLLTKNQTKKWELRAILLHLLRVHFFVCCPLFVYVSHVHMKVFICKCVCVCVCMYVSIYIVHVCMYVCVYIYCICINTILYICMYTNAYIYVYIYVYFCAFVYIYAQIQKYIYIYIYI